MTEHLWNRDGGWPPLELCTGGRVPQRRRRLESCGRHADTGVTGNKIIQAGNHEEVLRHTDRLVVLADATKIGRRGSTLLAGIDQLDTLVTSPGGRADQLDRIAAHDVQVEVAG